MKIAVIGTGSMGSAIIKALLRIKSRGMSVFAYDKSTAALKKIPSQVPVISPKSWNQKNVRPDVILLAVK
ncbi:MAG: hypothetical protein GF350_08845, partial [Chitinivibrionales bacterium]|nr:hypothetical protein [Chitinivibrionales bacterium]